MKANSKAEEPVGVDVSALAVAVLRDGEDEAGDEAELFEVFRGAGVNAVSMGPKFLPKGGPTAISVDANGTAYVGGKIALQRP